MNAKPEKAFETEFAFCANKHRCLYVKIPDAILTAGRLALMKRRGKSDEAKKPFDGILITPHGNLCLEFKYGYNKLELHQKAWREQINMINNTFFVLSKKMLKHCLVYTIMFPGFRTETADTIDEVMLILKGWRNK